MTDPAPTYAFRHKGRGLVWFLFLLAVVYTMWFAAVVYVENQSDTVEDPGAWAYLPTNSWALLGIGLFVFIAAIYLALLVRREVPARTYHLEEAGPTEPGGGMPGPTNETVAETESRAPQG